MEDKNLINSLYISAPCPVGWDNMTGDEKYRYCKPCKINVYNISEMTNKEAVKLVKANEGERLCIKLYRRWDGKVATNNCPVGLRWTRKVLKLGLACTVAAFLYFGLIDEASAQGLVGAPIHPGYGQSTGLETVKSINQGRNIETKLFLTYSATFLVAVILYLQMYKKTSLILIGSLLIAASFFMGVFV